MSKLEKFTAETDIQSYMKGYVKPEEFLTLCRACPNYGKLWSCPPYDFEVRSLWESFSKLKIIAYKLNLANRENYNQELANLKSSIETELRREEDINEGSLCLLAGCCELCSSCTRTKGQPCIFPAKMRYSIESLGGDVVKTLKDFFHIEIKWLRNGNYPEYTVLVGGLLMKKP
jgi:predicted metal-binding protein